MKDVGRISDIYPLMRAAAWPPRHSLLFRSPPPEPALRLSPLAGNFRKSLMPGRPRRSPPLWSMAGKALCFAYGYKKARFIAKPGFTPLGAWELFC